MKSKLRMGMLVVGCALAAGGLSACEVDVGRPTVEAGVDVGVAPGVVDVGPDVWLNYYDAPWSPGGYYVYRFDHGYYYLDRYHQGPHGERIFDHTYRVPRAAVHGNFSAHAHESREHPEHR